MIERQGFFESRGATLGFGARGRRCRRGEGRHENVDSSGRIDGGREPAWGRDLRRYPGASLRTGHNEYSGSGVSAVRQPVCGCQYRRPSQLSAKRSDNGARHSRECRGAGFKLHSCRDTVPRYGDSFRFRPRRGRHLDQQPAADHEGLRGKVVMIDFWDYTCINCIRTFPENKKLWDRYRKTALC